MGNIRLKYSDVRISLDQLDIVGVYNYYPFGQLIENRTWEGSSARFGFQGQERDDEIAGKGNSLHYTARDYSTQTARMDRIDPLSDKFPSQSPYVTSGNSPIMMVDVEGEWARIVNQYRYFWQRNPSSDISGFTKLQKAIDAKEYPANSHYLFTNDFRFDKDRFLERVNQGQYRTWSKKGSNHYAPKVAQYLKSTDIGIGIASSTLKSTYLNGARVNGFVEGIGINRMTLPLSFLDPTGDVYDIDSPTFFHELVHSMGYGEFGAFAASFAAKYETFPILENSFFRSNDPKLREYILQGIPENLKEEFFDSDNKIKAGMEGKFEAEFLKYGNEIIGVENGVENEVKNEEK